MKAWLAVLLILMSLNLPSAAQAQNSCESPFEGVSIRFSNGFWTKTDFCNTTINLAEVISGGPPPNAIPPIGFPEWADPINPARVIPPLPGPIFEPVEGGRVWLQDQSPVIALEIDGEARAYPLAILTWHEIVNDVVGSVPVAVTFCPLCNSSIVFDRRVGEAELFFGTTGNLRKSDLIMWDDQTQSWWQQFTGEGIVGQYAGEMLTMLPSQVVGFGQFAAQYPEGQVLSRQTGTGRDYGRNPYAGYDSGEPFLFEGVIDRRLAPTARVLAGLVNGEPVAYPFRLLARSFVINDTVAEQAIVAFWQDGQASALDASQIDAGVEVGSAALYSRVLNDETLTFTADAGGSITDEQTGSTWNAFGVAVDGPLTGERLRQIVASPHFWFAWAAFRPETALYGSVDSQ